MALLLLGCLPSRAPEQALATSAHTKESLPTSSAGVASEIEQNLYDLLNRERSRHGRPRLKPDFQLQNLARLHSIHMARTQELSHVNDLGEGPTERARNAGINTVKRTGNTVRSGILENVGFMPVGSVKHHGVIRTPRDVARAMTDEWMRSTSHRANMLNPDVTHVGIGAASDARGTFYLTMDMR